MKVKQREQDIITQIFEEILKLWLSENILNITIKTQRVGELCVPN